MSLTLRTLAAALALGFAATSALAADLTIEIAGVADAKGSVYVALYDKSDTWMKKAFKTSGAEAAKGSTIVVFKDLPEGDYAFSVFHDENGDKKMARNAMGMPTEPWGFSKDAMGMFGPPSFDEAKVSVPAEGARAVVNLKG